MPSEAKRLARLVVEMREKQNAARRLKTPAAWARAGVAEREVDEACKRVIAKREQGILWDQP